MNPAFSKNNELNNIKRGGVKVFIIYASAGSGHFKSAQAIHSYFKERCEELDVKLVDVLEKANILFKSGYTHGYAFLVKYAPWLWSLGFWVTYVKTLRAFMRPIASFLNRLNTKSFSKFLSQENPDFIISTHFLPAELAAYLKSKHKINSKLVTVITDFGVHPFWISEGIDIYVVASDFTKSELILEGVKEQDIKELGIPIELKFLTQYEKGGLFTKFGLERNKFTVLMVTGSFGIGPIEEMVDLLHKDAQLLVVCAKNKRLYSKLKHKAYPDVRIFGFIDNIQELMAISDLIITKPGGLGIAESLTMDLPPIFIAPIPGQESENIKILAYYGIGIYPRKFSEIKNIVIDLKQHPEKLKNMRNLIYSIKKPDAVKELCNVVCQGSCGFTD